MLGNVWYMLCIEMKVVLQDLALKYPDIIFIMLDKDELGKQNLPFDDIGESDSPDMRFIVNGIEMKRILGWEVVALFDELIATYGSQYQPTSVREACKKVELEKSQKLEEEALRESFIDKCIQQLGCTREEADAAISASDMNLFVAMRSIMDKQVEREKSQN